MFLKTNKEGCTFFKFRFFVLLWYSYLVFLMNSLYLKDHNFPSFVSQVVIDFIVIEILKFVVVFFDKLSLKLPYIQISALQFLPVERPS